MRYMYQPARGGQAIEQSESRAERVRLLSMVDVLEALMAEEIDRLAQRITERAVARGESMYAQGDTSSEVLFMLLTGVCVCTGWQGAGVHLRGALGWHDLQVGLVDGAHP